MRMNINIMIRVYKFFPQTRGLWSEICEREITRLASSL